MFGDIRGYFEIHHFLSNNNFGYYYLCNIWKSLATFYNKMWSHWIDRRRNVILQNVVWTKDVALKTHALFFLIFSVKKLDGHAA